VSGEFERMWKEAAIALLGCCPYICLGEGLRKTRAVCFRVPRMLVRISTEHLPVIYVQPIQLIKLKDAEIDLVVLIAGTDPSKVIQKRRAGSIG
jgi:hypothetical protein